MADLFDLAQGAASRLANMVNMTTPMRDNPRDPLNQVGGASHPMDRRGFDGPIATRQDRESGYSVGYNSDPFRDVGWESYGSYLNARNAGQQAGQAAQSAFGGKQTPSAMPNTGGGGGASTVPTSADNQGLTGEKINAWISQTRGNSPLAGMGDYILQEANRQGVSVPQLMGIMLLESGLGTEQGTLPGVYNYGGLTGSGWEGQTGNTTGMARAFATFNSRESGVKALISNLATPAYRGRTIVQQTGLWYMGNPNMGLGDSDEAGNATLQQYLDVIGSAYQGLGVPFNPYAAPQTVAPPQQPQGGAPSMGGDGSLFNGASFPTTQEFGHTGFSQGEGAGIYDFGTQFGLDGDEHSGLDIGTPVGTKFYMPAGLSGTVTIVGKGPGGYFYTDEQLGPGEGRGELRITLDNGWELILGHNSAINVRPGERVSAGQLLGQTGWANGAHLHLELRIPDRSTPSGWRIVDPRKYFKF